MAKKPLDQNIAGPWNPGIQSRLPPQYLSLSSIFRPENVLTSIDSARELSQFSGLSIQQLVRFRPERLVIHELLIRVSADIFVSDGSRYEDLGVNFRRLVSTLLESYIAPEMPQILHRFQTLQCSIKNAVDRELSSSLFATVVRPATNKQFFHFRRKAKTKPHSQESVIQAELRTQAFIAQWLQQAETEAAPLQRSIYRQLARTTTGILMQHGRLIGDQQLLTSLVSGLVANDYGSDMLGDAIEPFIQEAVSRECLSVLPAQEEPIVINIKGASASGKSTMRPLQKEQTRKIGVNWHDFALISPDIWRKYLLDYDALGTAYKYAGTLTGDEIPIIDQKLDRYIRRKAEKGRISHMLIDRFRFDSFAPGRESREGSNLLTRFGHTVYLTFMVTPPEATVERAWQRGLKVGRFKSVDDLLDHNIEAFKGMPILFFTWALNSEKTVHYEFLDNGVPYGKKPRSIAFGTNGEMYIYDMKSMFDIVRYTKINIEADSPETVYPKSEAATENLSFLILCQKKIPKIHFVDRTSGFVYATMISGKMAGADYALTAKALENPDTRAGFQAIAEVMINNIDQVPPQPATAVAPEALQYAMGDLGGQPITSTEQEH